MVLRESSLHKKKVCLCSVLSTWDIVYSRCLMNSGRMKWIIIHVDVSSKVSTQKVLTQVPPWPHFPQHQTHFKYIK